MDDNWIVENLENALATWNEKLAEIWQLVSMTPQEFKGGGIWNIVVQINGALQAIGDVYKRQEKRRPVPVRTWMKQCCPMVRSRRCPQAIRIFWRRYSLKRT